MGLGGIMENYDQQQQLQLPPGFRFHPTDEELITHYLTKKVFDNKFVAIAIGDVDMNKVEPWNLPWNAKMGEDEWYFFCVRDKKYPTGMRANRATVSGYWKATGKDKEIFKGNSLVGMKKTLVFYRGRAPKGEKTNWVAHEYRLEGKSTIPNLPKSVKNEWVICRVFKKTAGGKKIHISCLGQSSSLDGNEMVPPLMDTTSPPFSGTTRSNSSIVVMPESGSHVHCFSNSINPPPPPQKRQDDMFMFNNNNNNNTTTAAAGVAAGPFMGVEDIFQRGPFTNTSWGGGSIQANNTCQFSKGYTSIQDNGILRDFMENYGQKNMKLQQSFKTEERFSASQETGISTDINNEITSVVSNLDMGKNFFEDQGPSLTSSNLPQGLDCIWNY